MGSDGIRFLPRTFRGGGYEVTIQADRSIKVRPGDWLSKYSMAIYGDFDHIDRFYRKVGGNYQTILNKDRIEVGETLYHPGKLPGEPASGNPGTAPIGISPPGGLPPVEDGQPKSSNVALFLKWFYERFVKTDWKVTGTGGGDLSFSFLTAQYATICLEHKPLAVQTWFHALAGGLTLGWPSEGFSMGGSFSTTHFPSAGTVVRFAWRSSLSLNDFRHGIVVLEFGANFFVGGAASIVIFGIQFPAILLKGIFDFFVTQNWSQLRSAFERTAPNGCLLLAGANAGIPGASVAGRVGAMYDRGYIGI